MTEPAGQPLTYAGSGVDIDAGERAVDRIRPLVAATRRPEVVGDLGDFGGLFALDVARYRHPVLVASTDGVGTKAVVARQAGRYDTIGIDLVAMCVDDLVCQGAEPLFLLDYVATGVVEPERMAELVGGVAAGCARVGATLLGGEMAEHAGVLDRDEFDLVGFAVGVVERDGVLGSARVRPGDVLVGLPSPGLRSNGYTLARRVLLGDGRSLDEPAWDGASTTLADELLLPSVLYAPAVLAAVSAVDVHAVAHVTGGGVPGNLARVVPEGLVAVVERGTWPVPQIFGEIRRRGPVADDEMVRVFNVGLGMVVVVPPPSVDGCMTALAATGHEPVVVGRVDEARGSLRPPVELVGPPLWAD